MNQDNGTANAIGSKSYNALTGELVALETRNMEVQQKNNPEEDCVDFVAATTAALGVPSPSLSKARSFDDSPHSVSDQEMLRKGDLEEEAELLRVLKLSESDSVASVSDPVIGHANGRSMSVSMDDNTSNKNVITVDSKDELDERTDAENNDFHEPEPLIPDDCTASGNDSNEHMSSASTQGKDSNLSIKTNGINCPDQLTSMEPEASICQNKDSLDKLVQNESATLLSPAKDSVSLLESHTEVSERSEKVQNQSTLTNDSGAADDSHGHDATVLSILSATDQTPDLSGGRCQQTDGSGALSSSVDGSEPLYEGEECVLDTRNTTFQDDEPVYEGEVVLAEQADKSTSAASDVKAKDEITPQQGQCY